MSVPERTAQAYMRVATGLPNTQPVADLSFREALKLLAEPKLPVHQSSDSLVLVLQSLQRRSPVEKPIPASCPSPSLTARAAVR